MESHLLLRRLTLLYLDSLGLAEAVTWLAPLYGGVERQRQMKVTTQDDSRWVFWFLNEETFLCLAQRPSHLDNTRFKVQVFPPQSQYLAPPHACCCGNQNWNMQASAMSGF